MVSTSGSKLLTEDALKAIYKDLLPNTFILTPNIPEALYLLRRNGEKVKDVEDMKSMAAKLAKFGPRFVLVKGGHVPMLSDGTICPDSSNGEVVVDVLYDSSQETYSIITKPFIQSKHTHGTGCSLASAIASNLAKGLSPVKAVKEASKYISWAIESSPGFGHGAGPINHLHSNYKVPFAP